jgi:hypothetical protein
MPAAQRDLDVDGIAARGVDRAPAPVGRRQRLAVARLAIVREHELAIQPFDVAVDLHAVHKTTGRLTPATRSVPCAQPRPRRPRR